MTPEQIKTAIDSAIGAKVILTYPQLAVLALLLAAAAYFGGYFSKKGKNLATKEDVGRITDAIKNVELGYAKQLETFKQDLENRYRLEEKGAENAFILSATSHMAQRAFDKHVEFCEKYVPIVRKGLVPLFQREGPTTKASEVAIQLHQVRLDFELWETKDIAVVLDGFENTLLEIGANTNSILHSPTGQNLTELINRTYDAFKKVMTLETLPNEPTPEIAVAHIIAGLRNHLGVSQLTALRKHYLSEAAKRIK